MSTIGDDVPVIMAITLSSRKIVLDPALVVLEEGWVVAGVILPMEVAAAAESVRVRNHRGVHRVVVADNVIVTRALGRYHLLLRLVEVVVGHHSREISIG